MTAAQILDAATVAARSDEWLQARRAGVSASEIAAVLGISPWESPFSLFWRKVNGWEIEPSDEMRDGLILEPAIAEWWAAECDPLQNLTVQPAGLFAGEARPWQLASPDRLVHMVCPKCDGTGRWGGAVTWHCRDCSGKGTDGPPLAVLECKWSAHSWDGWGEPGTDEIPVHYRAQVLWQLDVLDLDEAYVAALGPGGFRAYRVRRDETDLTVMRRAGAQFMARLAAGDAPDVDSHAATVRTLKQLHPDVEDIDVPVLDALAVEYGAAREAAAEAKARRDLAEARIRAAIGSGRRAVLADGTRVATRSVYVQRRVDVAALRADLPEVADKYSVQSIVDKLVPATRRKKEQ